MKFYIKENIKIILAVTIMLFGACALIASNEIRAQILPVVSEELKVVYCEVEKEVCDYTGKAIENKINRIIFADNEENRIVMYKEDFKIKSYIDNIEVGQADIEISVNGYQETIIIKNAFTIQPAKPLKPRIVNATRNFIDLMWNEVVGADGYLLYKSKDNGKSYMPIKEMLAGRALIYTDKDVASNEMYLYYVRAYEKTDQGIVFGNSSDALKIYTPLDNPVISEIKNVAYNTLQIEWIIVNGSTGYQVYRSDKQDGEYILLAEISDGLAMSYSDTTCECGKTYYYYIKACQTTDLGTFYGDASEVSEGRTTPGPPSLRGVTNENETKVALSWKKVQGAQGYEVFKDDKLVAKIEKADVLTWEETGLSKDLEITYKIRAYCVVNNEIIYGEYSGPFIKNIMTTSDYSQIISGELSSLTQFQGVPYVPGGATPKGWDCSGFTRWVMKNYFGVDIPYYAAAQGKGGQSISISERESWKPGDILCYTKGSKSNTVTHVALYLGNGKMIHALSEKHDTIIHDVDFYESWDSHTKLYTVKRYY